LHRPLLSAGVFYFEPPCMFASQLGSHSVVCIQNVNLS